ncbi:MAG TPA: formate dehydrogenase subunit gamma [Pyrinomonadaceae bacterium]|nr:formate dehydrogenase subunit gamma [Pyrinomonadaceae bacterium]
MSSSVQRFDEKARRKFSRFGQTVVHRGELLRHPIYTRILHWTVAISFILSLLSGFAIYSPWLYRWLTPIFGGGSMTRLLHPWFGLVFNVAFFFQFLNWFVPMHWTKVDKQWLKQAREYVTNKEALAPRETGFFNGGQKLYFWSIAFCAIVFLVTGVLLWFDHVVPRWIVAVSYVLHDIAAVIMLLSFIAHIYETTAAQRGTFPAMVDGTVSEEWAWTHHPAWYSEVTGVDAREAYERARDRQVKRSQAIEAWENQERTGETTKPDEGSANHG